MGVLILSDYTAAIGEMVPGSFSVGADEKERAVAKAMVTHSKYRPRRIVEDVAGDGGFDYALSDLETWDADASRVVSVEYPVDDTTVETSLLEASDWQVYEKPAGKVLRLLNDVPQSGETLRVTYTAPHVCDTDSCTVAASDEEAVQSLAASYFCRMVAASVAQNQDSTIQADSVDHTSQRAQYEAQAQKYRAEYNEHMGIQPGKPAPACQVQDQDVNYPWGGDRLTHPRRWR